MPLMLLAVAALLRVGCCVIFCVGDDKLGVVSRRFVCCLVYDILSYCYADALLLQLLLLLLVSLIGFAIVCEWIKLSKCSRHTG